MIAARLAFISCTCVMETRHPGRLGCFVRGSSSCYTPAKRPQRLSLMPRSPLPIDLYSRRSPCPDIHRQSGCPPDRTRHRGLPQQDRQFQRFPRSIELGRSRSPSRHCSSLGRRPAVPDTPQHHRARANQSLTASRISRYHRSKSQESRRWSVDHRCWCPTKRERRPARCPRTIQEARCKDEPTN